MRYVVSLKMLGKVIDMSDLTILFLLLFLFMVGLKIDIERMKKEIRELQE